MHVGIIGAGIAGLTLGTRLIEAGHSALILDKGRQIGGRTSTRRTYDVTFDHGAQYFTIRDPEFRSFLDDHVPASAWAVWNGRFATLEGGRLAAEEPVHPRYVGVPGMSSIAEALASRLQTSSDRHVTRLAGTPGRWTLLDSEGREAGPFDWVATTAPPIQSAGLLDGLSPIAAAVAGVVMLPCISLAITPTNGASLPFDGIRCKHPVLDWAANDQSKPGRGPEPVPVIHSNPEWAAAHLEDDLPSWHRNLRQAACEAFGVDFGVDSVGKPHLWRYARPAEPLGPPCLVDPEARLAACGDWCLAAKVEGAYLSGHACARSLLELAGR